MSKTAAASATAAATAAATFLLKLTIPTGQASPSPPIGPALGQRGVKAMDLCRRFNELSSSQFTAGIPLRCQIAVGSDRSFQLTIRPPSTAYLLKRAAGIERLSSQFTVARMSVKVLYEIARQKKEGDPALKHVPLESVFKGVVGTARVCGIEIIG